MHAVALFALAVGNVIGNDIFLDPMSSGSNWDKSGVVSFTSNVNCPSPAGSCAWLVGSRHGDASISTAIPISAGFTQLSLQYDIKVLNLEAGEACHAEYSINNGATFTALASYGDAVEAQDTHNAVDLPLDTVSIDSITLRFRLDGGVYDYCYINNVVLSGDDQCPTPSPNPLDVLSGTNARSLYTKCVIYNC